MRLINRPGAKPTVLFFAIMGIGCLVAGVFSLLGSIGSNPQHRPVDWISICIFFILGVFFSGLTVFLYTYKEKPEDRSNY